MGGAVARFEPANESWIPMNPPGLTSRVTCIAVDDSDVWVGSFGNGLFRLSGGVWESFTTLDGLADGRVEDLALGGGYLFVATVGGASRVSLGGEPSLVKLGVVDGLPEATLTAARFSGGSVWFGTKANGVLQVSAEPFAYQAQVSKAEGLSDSRVLALATDEDALWVGTGSGGLCRYDLADGSIITYNASTGLVDNLVGSVAADSKVWAGSWGAGCTSIDADGNMRSYTMADGLASGDIRDIAVDDRYVWFATAKGVTRFRDETAGGGGREMPLLYLGIIVLAVAAGGVVLSLRSGKGRGREKEGPSRRKRPYEICGGKPDENLCPFCRYNVIRGGKHHCSKYNVKIPFD